MLLLIDSYERLLLVHGFSRMSYAIVLLAYICCEIKACVNTTLIGQSGL